MIARLPAARLMPAVTLLLLAACGGESPTAAPDPATEVTGATGGMAGATMAPVATTTTPGNCNGTLGTITTDDVVVRAAMRCRLVGTRVRGSVRVGPGASLEIDRARVIGSLQAEDALAVRTLPGTVIEGNVQATRRASVRLDGTVVTGDVQVEEAGASLEGTATRVHGNVQVSKAERVVLDGFTVRGTIDLVENLAAITVTGAEVAGNLVVEKNRGGVTLLRNRIAQTLVCHENRPAPVGSGNLAGAREGQCRSF